MNLTVAQALQQARMAGLDRLDAQLLLGHVLKQDRAWLVSHDQDLLTPQQQLDIQALVQRRAAGEPAAYLLGQWEFHGLPLKVTPDVLIPRPDTEVLVDWALRLLADASSTLATPRVLDLGTGSGAIALAVKHHWPAAQVTALDASAAALAVAQGNAQSLNLSVRFLFSDWWQALANERFDLVLSNPPYIAGADPHLAALQHEPRSALTPEGDGLDAIRALLQGAPGGLNPGAWMLIEHGWDQGTATRELMARQGFDSVSTLRDLGGQERCTGGQWMA